jgi:hypothetical protein
MQTAWLSSAAFFEEKVVSGFVRQLIERKIFKNLERNFKKLKMPEPALPEYVVKPKAELDTELVNRESSGRKKTGYLMFAVVVSSVGSFSKMDYNIPIFLFELVRDRYFYDVPKIIPNLTPNSGTTPAASQDRTLCRQTPGR